MLTSVQAQRTIAVLSDTLEKLDFLGSITPDVLAHRDELSQFVGDEISRIIDEQRKLEQRYEELIAQRGNLKGLSNKSKYKENQLEIQDVSRALRESTKNLCRNLKDNPNVSGNLLKIQDERNELQDLISRTINEISSKGSFKSLISYVEDAKIQQDRLSEIVEKEKETSLAVHQLEEELKREKVQHTRLVKERKQMIAELKEELQEIRSKLSFETKYARKEAEAKTESTIRSFERSKNELSREISKLEKMKALEENVHGETAAFLAKKKESLMEQAAEWSEKHANDVEEMDNRIRTLQDQREEDLIRLTALQERRQKELAEEEARLAEIQRQKELEEIRIKEEAEQAKAAGKIQKHYRKYLSTKEQGKGKKGKGKKGKGKKK